MNPQDGWLEVEPDKPQDRRADREVILLLHGLGGDKDDWRFPAWRELHWDHKHHPPNRDRGSHPLPPINPWEHLPEFGLSAMREDVRCWHGVLKALGHTVINYSQDGKQDTVDVPLDQFERIIVPFIREQVLTGSLEGKRVVLLCHSRGGILARAYLHRNRQVGSEWIGRVITLCSPHQGSHAAEAKQGLADTAASLLLGPAGGLAASVVTQLFDVFAASAGATQLLPDNPLFTQEQLASPAEVPSIEFTTFGGTSPRFGRVYSWHYTPDTYVPQWDLLPFEWTLFPVELSPVSPMLDALPDNPDIISEEQFNGQGDGLVANARARIGGSGGANEPKHEALPINHAEALWDERLFAKVANLLGTPLSEAGPVECASRALALTAQPRFVSFGFLIPPGETVTHKVEIRNDTGRLVSVQVPPAPPGVFNWEAVDQELPSGERIIMRFTFRPVNDEIRYERVRVTSTAGTVDIWLLANDPGIFADFFGIFRLERDFRLIPQPPPFLFFDPSDRSELDFGIVDVGRKKPHSLIIRNETGRSVRIAIDAADPKSPFQWPAVRSLIATGAERRVPITFIPQTTATLRSTIVVTSTTASSPESIRLVGNRHLPTGDGPDQPDTQRR